MRPVLVFRFGPNLGRKLEAGTKLNNYETYNRSARVLFSNKYIFQIT